jgi:prepilin-type N-terminal cleavage/methylation domain-containing protein
MKSLDRRTEGFTLVELLVAMILMSFIGLLVTSAVLITQKDLRRTDDESRGLADMRAAGERLARDIRDARGVTISTDPSYTATASQITIWIDYNSDYVQQTGETITWRLQAATGGHYNLVRQVKAGSSRVQARTLVSNLAFGYCLSGGTCTTSPVAPADQYDLVSVDMTYDAVVNAANPNAAKAAGSRHVVFQTRLRNVAW